MRNRERNKSSGCCLLNQENRFERNEEDCSGNDEINREGDGSSVNSEGGIKKLGWP